MMEKKSNRELFESLGVIDTTWRKWSREFLPPDPEVGLRKGRTRMYTAEEAFRVWAGGKMLNEKQMTYDESKEALEVLFEFMEKQELLPLWDQMKNNKVLGPNGTPAHLYFIIERTTMGNRYLVRGSIESKRENWSDKDAPIDHYIIEKYFIAPLSDGGDEIPVICTVDIYIQQWLKEFADNSGFKIVGVGAKTQKK